MVDRKSLKHLNVLFFRYIILVLEEFRRNDKDMKIIEMQQKQFVDTEADISISILKIIDIVQNPYQPRTTSDSKGIEEIAASIKSMGILQPLLARKIGDKRYELIAGHRRLKGAILAGLEEVPVIVKDVTDKEMLQMAIVENVHREDMSPIDKANGYKRLITQFKMTQNQLSEMIGISRSAIANTIRLLELPDNIINALHQRKITEGHARALLSIKNDDRREIALRRIVVGSMSVREAEVYTKRIEKSELLLNNKEDKTERSPEESGFIEYLQERLGTKVSIKYNGTSGKIEIEFYSIEQLRRIADIL